MKTQDYKPHQTRYQGGIIVPIIITAIVFGSITIMGILYGF